MTGKVFLHVAILFGILSPNIRANFSGEGKPSNIHVRHKRVINPNNNLPQIRITKVPFIVNIKKNDSDICAGSILSTHIVLSVGHAFYYDAVSTYEVYSGHEDINKSEIHSVTARVIYHGIALLTVNQPFTFNRYRQPIQIYNHPLPRGAHGTVYGWGCNIGPPTRFHRILRSIDVPILTYRECAHLYKGQFQVREDHICTRDSAKKMFCGPGDYGAPLIYSRRLVGIYVWSEDDTNHFNPDVFINLQLPQFRSYINEYIQRFDAQHGA